MKYLLTIILVASLHLSVLGQWCSGDARIFIEVPDRTVIIDDFKIKNILQDGEKSRRAISLKMSVDSNDAVSFLIEYPNGCGLATLSFDILNTKTKEKMHLDLKYLPEGYPTFRLPKFEVGNFYFDYYGLSKCILETKDEQNKEDIYICDGKRIKAINTRFYFPEVIVLDLDEFQVKETVENN